MTPNEFNEFNDLIKHLSDNARAGLQQAGLLAHANAATYVGTEHMLLGIVLQEASLGAKVLNEHDVNVDKIMKALDMRSQVVVVNGQGKGMSETAKLTLKMAWDTARANGQDFCGTEHILYGLASQKNSKGSQILSTLGVDVDKMLGEIESYLSRGMAGDPATSNKTGAKPKTYKGALDYYGTNLTEQAKNGKLDPLIGRDKELKRMITILARRGKNNPVLIGEPGVGKTAIVEGLAQKIIAEDVPDMLLDKKVYTLDVAGMVAGTKYRGEFEERIKKVIDEITDDSSLIVFIDELHLLIGAGSAEGTLDAANILKPALARGSFKVIGATTLDEYRKYIEKDAALERRFQPVVVEEPSLSDAVAIIKGLRASYEKHHGVTYSDAVVEEAVSLSNRYINDRRLPDKAIDLIDEAGAHVKIDRKKIVPKQKTLEKELKDINIQMDGAAEKQDYQLAALCKTRISQINAEIETIKAETFKEADSEVTVDDLAHVIASATGIPVNRVVKSEAGALRNLDKHLKQHVIGQDEAVDVVAKAIKRSRVGVSKAHRPVGSFLFMGPTGVGKTELARVLAREYFGSDKSLVKIDMSEFAEKHNVSRLVGAPAGFVGYEDAGQLTEKIRRQPHSLVLFDEIEKAHPEVFNILLQVMEDGYLTDAKGRRISFASTVIIMTSNVGAKKLQKGSSLGFAGTVDNNRDDQMMDELKKLMKPELINRLDGIVVFKPLTPESLTKIFDLQIGELAARMRKTNIAVQVSPAAKKLIVEKGYSEAYGARELARTITKEIEDPLSDSILEGKIKAGDTAEVKLVKNAVVIGVLKDA
jgi:ATP-dependent Clp protease ATP-binding subunit ClpC